MVLDMLTRLCFHSLNLTLVDPGETLPFPRVLLISCWAGCPPMSPPQLNHEASAVPGGPCPCSSALSSLVFARGTSLTGITLAHMEWTCASLHIPHMLLTFLAATTTLQACVTPMGCCTGPWSPLTRGKIGTNPERHRESWTCTSRAALCLAISGHPCIRCIMLLFEASHTSLVKTAPLHLKSGAGTCTSYQTPDETLSPATDFLLPMSGSRSSLTRNKSDN